MVSILRWLYVPVLLLGNSTRTPLVFRFVWSCNVSHIHIYEKVVKQSYREFPSLFHCELHYPSPSPV